MQKMKMFARNRVDRTTLAPIGGVVFDRDVSFIFPNASKWERSRVCTTITVSFLWTSALALVRTRSKKTLDSPALTKSTGILSIPLPGVNLCG